MAYIIDSTYFIENKVIPNLSETVVGTALTASLNWHISVYEPEFLTNMLGSVLYAEFVAGLAVSPTPLQKWTDLKNKLADATKKISPIANYIYWFYSKNRISTGMPDETPAFFNPVRSIYIWNEMVNLNYDFNDWLEENESTYPSLSDREGTDELVNLFSYTNILGI